MIARSQGMYYCSTKVLQIVAYINERAIINTLGRVLEKRHGKLELPIGKDLKQKLVNVRKLHHRFIHGDYRINDQEWAEIKEVGEYLIVQHNRNRGTEPPTPVHDWTEDEAGRRQNRMAADGIYQLVRKMVNDA
jgi:hypothetical protein